MSESDQHPLPPATFEFFVLSMKMQAEMALGLFHMGDDAPPRDPRVARHSIDLLAMILEKTRGNLSVEEQRLLENSLTELRFRYVQALESKPAEAKSPEPQAAEEHPPDTESPDA